MNKFWLAGWDLDRTWVTRPCVKFYWLRATWAVRTRTAASICSWLPSTIPPVWQLVELAATSDAKEEGDNLNLPTAARTRGHSTRTGSGCSIISSAGERPDLHESAARAVDPTQIWLSFGGDPAVLRRSKHNRAWAPLLHVRVITLRQQDWDSAGFLTSMDSFVKIQQRSRSRYST